MPQRKTVRVKSAGRSGDCGCSKRRIRRKKKSIVRSEVSNTDVHVNETKKQ